MTKQDLFRLSPTNIYKFTMYYGEEIIGILVSSTDDRYFIVPKSKIQSYNENPGNINKVGQPVSLDSIQAFNYEQQGYSFSSKANESIPNFKAKKMVILGAGASYDFSFDSKLKDNERPPLTYNLFDDQYDEILSKYPGANLLAARILQSENVEKFFQEQWDLIKQHYNLDLLNKIINTQYYLQHLFLTISNKCKGNKRSNYNSLVSQISDYAARKGEQVLITSFNYDTLIEQAVNSEYDYTYNNIDEYIDPNRRIVLFKPHGSWNWIREFKFGMYNLLSYSNNDNNELFSLQLYREKKSYADIFENLEEKVLIKDRLDLYKSGTSRSNFFLPQLLIPFTDKDDFVMPQNHRLALQANMSQIDELLIIGWKGTEAVFLDLLKTQIGNKAISVTVVNKNDDSIIETFENVLPNVKWIQKNTFSEYMKECQNSRGLFS